MMHKTLLFSLFGFTAAVLAAPTSLDAATLLQNGEEAQALNRFFKSLKAADPCQDGQVACLGSKTIAKCQGTAWETTVGQCSRSQNCFALPSVSSGGTKITCTSERSAEGLIAATGAVGGIFGGTLEVGNGISTQRGSDTSSAPSGVSPSTIIPDFTATATSQHPSATSGAGVPDTQDGEAGDSPTASHNGNGNATPSQSSIPDTTPVSISAHNSATGAPQAPSASNAGRGTVTVTVTLIPSQLTTLPPQTRTISPQDAAAIISSINAAGGSIVFASSVTSPNPTVVPASATISPVPVVAPPFTTQGSSGGYGGY